LDQRINRQTSDSYQIPYSSPAEHVLINTNGAT
jgi:hypothetical protein